MKILTRREWAFLALLGLYAFIPSAAGLLRVVELAGGVTLVPPNPRALSAPTPIILHILGSVIFCFLGALQFLPSLRGAYPKAHKAAGRVVVVAGCVSALTGLWMTVVYVFPQPLQGPLLYGARIVASAAMCALIVWAVIAVRRGNILQHQTAMLRAYAIGQGASTQTVLFMLGAATVGVHPLGLERDVIMVSAWLINLAAVELVIRTGRKQRCTKTEGLAHE